MLKTIMIRSALLAFAWALCVTAHAYASDPKQFDVPARDLIAALEALAKQSGLELVYQSEQVKGFRTKGVTGNLTPEEAVTKLLDGTPLTFRKDPSGAMLIAPLKTSPSVSGDGDVPAARQGGAALAPGTATASASSGEKKGWFERFRLAQNDQDQASSSSSKDEEDTQNPRKDLEEQMGEILVTAQKREERSIDVPMSITALSGAELAAAGIDNALDLSYAVPSLTVAETGPGRQIIVIRGFGSVRGSSSLTGVYLDEMPVTAAQDGFIAAYPDLRTIDLERVEVLKGPQGTLFGEGAAGGVIRFITKDPDLSRFGGEVSTQFYSTDDGGWSEEVTAVANAPLARDVFGIRLAATYEDKSGWIDQPSIGREDVNDSEVKHARLKALYAPTPNLRIKGMVEVHRDDGGASNIVNVEPRQDSNFLQAFDRSAPTDYVNDFDLSNPEVTYDFGVAELLSSTSYAELDSSQSFTQLVDAEPTPWLEILIRDYQLHASIFSQEFRLTSATQGRFNWTLGANYKDADLTQGFGEAGGDQVLFGGAIVRTGANANTEPTGTSESWAGFANASYQFANGIEVGGGVRYFFDERESFDQAAVPRTVLSDDFEKSTFRVYVKYQASDSLNFYANVATGFRSGGFNNPTFVLRGAPPSYEPEDAVSYELGAKMSVLDGRLRFDAALFYGEFDGMQDAITIISPVDGLPLQFTTNAQDAELKGVERDISWAATDRLTLGLAGDATDSEITWVDSASLSSPYLVGDPVNLVPKYSVSASVDYRFQLSGSVPGFFLLSFEQQGKSYYTSRNVAALTLSAQGVKQELQFLYASVGIQHAYHALGIDERRKPSNRPGFPVYTATSVAVYTPDGLANEALHWMVEKAESLGLEFGSNYLKPFRPCFNTKLHDSMSLKYRVFGPLDRSIGQHLADGEVVHQTAIDRRKLFADYRPPKLETYLAGAGGGAVFAQTARIPRGTPC